MPQAVLLVEANLLNETKIAAYWTADEKVKWFLVVPDPVHPSTSGAHEIDVAHAHALLLSSRS